MRHFCVSTVSETKSMFGERNAIFFFEIIICNPLNVYNEPFQMNFIYQKEDNIGTQMANLNYSKTCLKRPLKNRQNKGPYTKW